MIMMLDPMNTVFFRPSLLPSQMVATAPKKQPKVYAPTNGRQKKNYVHHK